MENKGYNLAIEVNNCMLTYDDVGEGAVPVSYTHLDVYKRQMHHVPPAQWPAFSKEMHRVLRPGGLALVFEHNPRNPLTMRAVNNCPFDEDAVLLKAETTIDLLKGAGFHDVERRYILSVPAGNRLLRKVDSMFSRIPFGAVSYTHLDVYKRQEKYLRDLVEKIAAVREELRRSAVQSICRKSSLWTIRPSMAPPRFSTRSSWSSLG